MEFGLSEDQRMFQASVKAYLEAESPLEKVRESAGGDEVVTAAITDGLSELGVSQIMVPEPYGGLGLGVLDAALVQEMLGRYVSPADFIGSVMATAGILSAGTEDQKQAWLPKIALGDVRFGIAVTERTGARAGAGVAARDGQLNGKSLFILEAARATHILVADNDGRLHIVDSAVDGLKRTTLGTIDKTRGFSELVFEDAATETLIGENDAGMAADRMVHIGRVLLAADTLGAAGVMLEKSVAYAMERKQFGRVIGSFQAVKHMCAEMAAEIEPARALVWHAAYALDALPGEGPLLACLAKSHLAEIGTVIARKATEVHGGMGFTDLVGLHYWFKRIGVNRQLLGGPERVRAEAARLQEWI